MAASRGSTHDKVKAFALSLPGAYEDHPWGESVVKVNKKVFVFLGHEETPAERGMAVKLTDSHDQALMVPGAQPTGYGLGRAGWVDVPMRKGPPLAVLKDWVEESSLRRRNSSRSSTRNANDLGPRNRGSSCARSCQAR